MQRRRSTQQHAKTGRGTYGSCVTVHDRDKPKATPIARRLHEMGFEINATSGTADYLRTGGVPSETVLKVHEGRLEAENAPGKVAAGKSR